MCICFYEGFIFKLFDTRPIRSFQSNPHFLSFFGAIFKIRFNENNNFQLVYLIYHRYLTDVLNIIQPLYVFIIFVLKKKVIYVIMGRDRRKSVTKTSKSKQSSLAHKNIIKTLQQNMSGRPIHLHNSLSFTSPRATMSMAMPSTPKPPEDISLNSLP